MEIDSIIKWIKDNYQTVDLIPPMYQMRGDYSDVFYHCICIVKKAEDPKKDYNHRYTVSVEEFCKELEDAFKDSK